MLYPAAAYSPEPNPQNFWQASLGGLPDTAALHTDHQTEVAIIGGGITGLSAALALAETGVATAILDAARPGWGASGRNGGLACIGGTKLSEADLLAQFGASQTRAFYRYQQDAIAEVATNLDRYNINADRTGHGEYFMAHRPKDFAHFRTEADAIRTLRGLAPTILSPEACRERGLHSPAFHGAMHIPVGFGLHPLKYTLGLFAQTEKRGIPYFSNTSVTSVERSGAGFILRTQSGSVFAQKVLIATNGYTQDTPATPITGWELPVLSNILVTRPLTSAELHDQGWNATEIAADTRILLHYFRLLPDNRMLFGMRGGTSLSPRAIAATQRRIRRDFEATFPAWADVETPHFWSGFVCLSHSRTAFVGPLDEGRYAALAYHGSGVAMASLSGRRIAEIITGHRTPDSLPAPLRTPPKPFPLPMLRRRYLQAAYLWYGLKDW